MHCQGKHGYPNVRVAREVMGSMMKGGRAAPRGERLEVYRCEFCELWHIGSARPRPRLSRP